MEKKLRIDPELQKLVPKLTNQQYRQLKEDIKGRGRVLEPLDVTDDNVILDGHNRWAAIQELKNEGVKVHYETRTVTFGDDRATAIPSFVRAVNLHRRHLTTEQKQKLIREELKANPTDSNREIAKMLGVDDKTIAAARKQMEATAEIPQSSHRKGRDNRTTNIHRVPRLLKGKPSKPPSRAAARADEPDEHQESAPAEPSRERVRRTGNGLDTDRAAFSAALATPAEEVPPGALDEADAVNSGVDPIQGPETVVDPATQAVQEAVRTLLLAAYNEEYFASQLAYEKKRQAQYFDRDGWDADMDEGLIETAQELLKTTVGDWQHWELWEWLGLKPVKERRNEETDAVA